jgi:hypothetical protein
VTIYGTKKLTFVVSSSRRGSKQILGCPPAAPGRDPDKGEHEKAIKTGFAEEFLRHAFYLVIRTEESPNGYWGFPERRSEAKTTVVLVCGHGVVHQRLY